MVCPQVLIVGGGMITQDQLLPSLYQMQRQGRIGEISIVALNFGPIHALATNELFARAFPGQRFRPYPDKEGPNQPNLFREVIAALPPRQIVVVAVPDQLHYDVIMTALKHNQHVCTVKPLVLTHKEAMEIEREARARSLVVGIEYHKRFDDRSLMARRKYREGWFGEFRLGTSCLFEKWYYRYSNFQNWMTVENSDSFTYIGCHYVDLVHFITGLLPVSVSLYGVKDKFPNGKEGYLWTDARIIWNNGACLNVQNGLSYPDDSPGTNTQGMTLYCSGSDKGTLIAHSDQYRGLKYSYTRKPEDAGSTVYTEPSPDYFQYMDLGGPGLTPSGYGFRSVEHIIANAIRVESAPADQRPGLLDEIDRIGIMATPKNSAFNEQVIEAGRKSIMDGGRPVEIR
ncbi:MAG: Gfo/Idh/MocA family oxidoreductase [Bryobacteraceae bacterium]